MTQIKKESLEFAGTETLDLATTEASFDGWISLALRMRDRRKAIFGSDLFQDPAWEIILFLGLDANIDGANLETIAVESGLSAETTRRWLAILADRGHVKRCSSSRFKLSMEARSRLPKIIL